MDWGKHSYTDKKISAWFKGHFSGKAGNTALF